MDNPRERLLEDDHVAEPRFQKAATAAASEDDNDPISCNVLWRVFFCAVVATLCNVAFGYDVGVVSGSLQDMAATLDLTTFQQEAATSGLNFVAGFGALLVSGNVLDLIGRRWTLMCASMLLLAGAAVVSSAPDFPLLLLGRALQGLGSGCSWCACSVYITELAPTEYRGSLVALADISINLGILIGYCVDYWVRTEFKDDRDLSWRLAMAIGAVWPLLYVLTFPCLPETPRWLMMKGRDKDALVVIRRTGGHGEAGARQVLNDIKAAHEAQAESELSWSQTLCARTPALRGTVGVAVALGLAQQLTGTEAILYYTPTLFKELDEQKQFLANLSVGFCKFFGELVAAYLAECAGRRMLMIWGNFALCLAVFGIAVSFMYDVSVVVSVACLSLVMLTFSIGPGPFTFVVVNEMLPLPYRGKGVASSVFLNRLGSGTVALTFLTLKKNVGVSNAFFLYGGIGLAVTLFYIRFLPELKGVSLEEAEASVEDDWKAHDHKHHKHPGWHESEQPQPTAGQSTTDSEDDEGGSTCCTTL